MRWNFHKLWGHFKTITEHKWLVLKGCFRLGLYRQGLTHDLSKYMPSEFVTGIRYYQGNRSPNAAEREAIGYSAAWLHHKGRNKHHYEYWMDFTLDKNAGIQGMKMPRKYVAEMFVDRVAACKIYKKDAYTDRSPWEYYVGGLPFLIIHPDTRKALEKFLKMLAVYGEDITFKFIRHRFLTGKVKY